MTAARVTVHVYSNVREFVVVPVVAGAEGAPVEITPAHHVSLARGLPTTVALALALERARDEARSAADGGTPWDGSRWWDHHLLHVAVTWEEEQVRLVPEAADDPPVAAPPDVALSELARWLVQHLGDRLL
jgi:hypothetical protein